MSFGAVVIALMALSKLSFAFICPSSLLRKHCPQQPNHQRRLISGIISKMASFTGSPADDSEKLQRLNFSWQQTMLRIKDPTITVPFYENNFGFKLIHRYDFPQWKFSLYFLGIFPEGQELPIPGTKASEDFLWTMPGTCLELTHNYGSELDETFKVNNGNVEPCRGFGHIAVMTPDVYTASAELEDKGVRFQKRPDEGRMKGLAFALDPDGYWIEIISRNPASPIKNKFTFAQTMLRVKDPVKSLRFYKDILGMTLLRESHYGVGQPGGFSLYFLACVSEDVSRTLPHPDSPEANLYPTMSFGPVIELTHNHGTESQPDFKYHNGNDQDAGQLRGFGHTGFLTDDLAAATAHFDAHGVTFKKRPEDGMMRGLAFVLDPDNYWVEIIQRNGLKMLQ